MLGFPQWVMLKNLLMSEVAVQDGRTQDHLVAACVLFGGFKMHGGFAMPSQFVQTNGLVEMRLSNGRIRLGCRLEMLQSHVIMSLAPVIDSFHIVFHRASVGTGRQRHGTFPSK